MLGVFKAVLPVAGMLLIVIASLPLINLYNNINNIFITYNITNNGNLIITLHYGAPISIKNYRFAVTANGTVLNETSGPLLEPGRNVTLRVPSSGLSNGTVLGFVFEGDVAGMYHVRFYVHGGEG